MNVAIGSAFRNMAGAGVLRYANQVRDLQRATEHTIRWIAAEGDSSDATRDEIVAVARRYNIVLDLRPAAHGGPHYSSTEQPERMRALSGVGNVILDGVREDDDVLIYVESDLLWQPETMLGLIDQLMSSDFDVLAPLVFAGDLFYDVWAFRIGGDRFSPFPPFHQRLARTGITSVDSAGSCLVMRSYIARSIRMTSGALVEWCANARSAGFTIGVTPALAVRHP